MSVKVTIPIIRYRQAVLPVSAADFAGDSATLWFAIGIYLPDHESLSRQLAKQGWQLRLLGRTAEYQYVTCTRMAVRDARA